MLHPSSAHSKNGKGGIPEAILCTGLSIQLSWEVNEKDAVIGLQALVRTLWMSGAYAAFENLVSMGYIFGARVPLFLFWCAPAVLSRCKV